jgi:hypothetical protein
MSALLFAVGARAVTIVPCSGADFVFAVEQANASPTGDTLSLTPGCTYTVTSPYGGSGPFAFPTVTKPITVIGNGATLVREEPSAYLGYGFFSIGLAGSLTLTNMTVANGAGSTAGFFFNGGSLVLQNMTITDNAFGNNQSAIVNVKTGDTLGQLAILNSTISGHVQPLGGAGAAVRNGGHLVVDHSTFSNNAVISLIGPAVQIGGAISNSWTAEIYDSTFTNNRSGAVGGAIANGGDLEIHRSTFTGGRANFGAAIDNDGTLLVDSSYFADNVALGGGAINNGGAMQVNNSTFYSNDANGSTGSTGKGGAIANSNLDNTASATIRNSTFGDNTADQGGSVVYTKNFVRIQESILQGPSPCLIESPGTIVDDDYNVVWPARGTCPAGFTLADPKLKSPALNGAGSGGPKTMALGAGSAAVDAFGPAGCPSFDQRGIARPQGPTCDAGALEDSLPTAPGTPSVSSGGNPNQGAFMLLWTAGSDPESQPLTHKLFHKDANDSDYSLAASPSGNSQSFNTEAEGTWTYKASASDGNHDSSLSAASVAVKVDKSAPTAPSAAADRAVDYSDSGTSIGWWKGSVTVTFSGSTDPALIDGSAGSGVASTTSPQVFSTSGSHAATGTSTDNAGNVSSTTTYTVHVDADAPSVTFTSCPADVLLKSTVSATWTASDAQSGLSTSASGSIPLDTQTTGSKKVTASASDNVGHTTSVECNYRVIFDFGGFFKPVANAPTYNLWTAGDNVPLSFSLAGNQGLAIFAAGYPEAAEIDCATTPSLETGVATTSVRGLTYVKGSDRYSYSWRTTAAWAGTCRQLIVKLVDGTYHRVNFRFD